LKALVTGGAGFIGSHLVDGLILEGHEVHVLDNLSSGSASNVHPDAVLHVMDIRDDGIRQLLAELKPDYVFHHAAQVDVQRSIMNPVEDAGINLIGTINLLEGCASAKIKKIIYASSCALYGDSPHPLTEEHHPVQPASYYGISKGTPEYYLQVYADLHGLRYTALRYANVYGPRQTAKGEGGVIAIFLNRILRGEPLTIFGDGRQSRDFVYVKDVVRANVAAINHADGRALNVSTALSTTVNQLVSALASIHGHELPVVHKPARPGDILHSCLSNRRAGKLLGWEPAYSLRQGLLESYDFLFRDSTISQSGGA
jgi:UDP-glucose 4-epimerase